MIRFAETVKESDNLSPKQWSVDEAIQTLAAVTPPPPPQPISPETVYESCQKFMREVGVQVQEGKEFDIGKGRRYVQALIKKSKTLLEDLHFLTLLSAGEHKDSLSIHAVNVMITALIIGKELGYARGELETLGTAALFHEIGMHLIPKSIRKNKGKLTDQELAVIRQHPELAFTELRKYGQDYLEIAEIIQQEHERIDGSGYPFGLEGAQIKEMALIVGLLDIYDALINSRPYRDKILPSDAMKVIVRRSKGLFPAAIIKKLLIQLSIYPVKSYVRLNNASIGMVVKTNTLWPLKPIITIIFDAQGRKIEKAKKMIDLSKSPLLYIKSVVLADDVKDF